MIFLLYCLTSLSMTLSRSTRVATKGIISLFQWPSNIPLYICTCVCVYMYTVLHIYNNIPLYIGALYIHALYICTCLYPLPCQWPFRLRPWLGYCKLCCNEPWGGSIFTDHVFLHMYVQEWNCRVVHAH